jgi:alkanesulfonate monooxygenase SsuD/methylene tetrahydromethanopterin reductase-like flavin-dependent oxidoreductase (luciferase family)
MRFGVFSLSDNNYGLVGRSEHEWFREFLDQAGEAERLGFDSVWVGEHHVSPYGVCPSPQVLLAAVAGRTERVRLAPAVAILPYNHPIRMAEDYATLDVLSGGRLDFAVGRGFLPHEFEVFGVPLQENRDRFRENLEIILKAWTEPEFSYRGRWHNYEGVQLVPKPLQHPHPPVYVAAFSPSTLEWAATAGHSLLLAPFAATRAFGSLENAVQTFRQVAAANGHPEAQVICSYFIHVAETPSDEDLALMALIRYFRSLAPSFPVGSDVPDHLKYWEGLQGRLLDLKPEQIDSGAAIIGDLAYCREQVERLCRLGINEVILYFSFGAIPHDIVLKNMRLFAEGLLPAGPKSRSSG